ncbi:MAG: hypothetical protein EAX86_00315 [Candidatus Heimdallarchaeota archaeon]|nr:hypothetical protein [Candidatus Heimdallarchaeota archaeon]
MKSQKGSLSQKNIIEISAQIITYYEENQISLRNAMKIVETQFNVEDPESYSRIHALVFETVRHQNVLNRLFHNFFQKYLANKVETEFRNLLRVITYLLTFSDQKNDENLWFETQKILDGSKFNNYSRDLSKNYIIQLKNWELDHLLKEIEDPEEKLAVGYSHPTWFVRDLIKFYGLETAVEIFKSNNIIGAVYVRLNLLNYRKEEIFKRLQEEKVNYQVDSDLNDVLKIISSESPLPRLQSFIDNMYYMQNKGSALISHVLNPQKNDLILDTCAAPGGKTFHIMTLVEDSAKVIAIDNNFRRMNELLKKIQAFRVENIYPIIFDLRISLPFKMQFDKILVDAPCSGSGTFSSRPDSKWRVDRHHVKWLSKLQYNLLDNAAKYLRKSPEAALVYSTCSLLPQENEEVISRFLRNNKYFTLNPQSPFIGVPSPSFPLAQRLFPHIHETEGFSIFKMGWKDIN